MCSQALSCKQSSKPYHVQRKTREIKDAGAAWLAIWLVSLSLLVQASCGRGGERGAACRRVRSLGRSSGRVSSQLDPVPALHDDLGIAGSNARAFTVDVGRSLHREEVRRLTGPE